MVEVTEIEGPATIPNQFRILIQVTDLAANRIRIFQFRALLTVHQSYPPITESVF